MKLDSSVTDVGQLILPTGLAIANDGNLFVLDSTNSTHRIRTKRHIYHKMGNHWRQILGV